MKINFILKKILLSTLLFVLFNVLQIIKGDFYFEETAVVLVYLLILIYSKNFKPNFDYFFAPQNIAFFIFFMRLYFLPCLTLYFGYNNLSNINNYSLEWITKGYFITITMYISFVIGWEIKCSMKKHEEDHFFYLSKKNTIMISLFYLSFGLISLILFFKDIQTYLLNIYLSSSKYQIENEKNKFLTLFASQAKFFLPFAVFGFINLIDLTKKSKISKFIIIIFSLIIVLFFTLNTNRQNFVYPILALFVGFSTYIKIKPIKTAIIGIVAIYFLFVFSNIRSNQEIDVKGASKDSKEIVTDLQVYIGGSQMIAPIFKMKEKKFTIFHSFISSFPVIGEPFRENSGVALYNKIFYGHNNIEDQVFLTQAECYTNGGYLLVIIFFLIIGYSYSSFNIHFLESMNSQFLYRVSFYYLVLLFNSTILLSFQVMGQFLFYNAIPALLIMFFYRKESKLKHS